MRSGDGERASRIENGRKQDCKNRRRHLNTFGAKPRHGQRRTAKKQNRSPGKAGANGGQPHRRETPPSRGGDGGGTGSDSGRQNATGGKRSCGQALPAPRKTPKSKQEPQGGTKQRGAREKTKPNTSTNAQGRRRNTAKGAEPHAPEHPRPCGRPKGGAGDKAKEVPETTRERHRG